jgi:hypothetical protein
MPALAPLWLHSRAVHPVAIPGSPRLTASRRAVLLIDWEEDRTLQAVLVGMLREADRGR